MRWSKIDWAVGVRLRGPGHRASGKLASLRAFSEFDRVQLIDAG
jgi:hypothetical protein